MSLLSDLLDRAPVAACLTGWRWWIGELTDMVPSQLSALFARSPVAFIYPSRACVEIDRVALGVGERFLETCAIEDFGDDNWAELDALTRDCRTHIILRAPDVFVTSLTLPRAAARHWKSATELQLSHLAPVDPALLVWNAEVTARDKEQVKVRVAMARTQRIEALQSLFDARDLRIFPIDAGFAEGRMALALGAAKPRGSDRLLWHKALIISAALLLTIPISIGAGAHFLSWSLDRRSEELAEELGPRLANDRSWQRGEKLRISLAQVTNRGLISPLVDDIARLLPDSGFVESVEGTSDRSVLVTVTTNEPKKSAEALATSNQLPGLDVADQIPGSGNQITLTLRTRPR
jgi:hypothetical protein